MTYRVRLEVFEGPFDLLFHLIEAEEIDIWRIPIASLTEQYLDYLASWSEMELEIAGEFLVMAATLLALKARMLLPDREREAAADEDEGAGDPQEELAQRLLTYKRFKAAGVHLGRLAKARQGMYTRPVHVSPARPVYTNPVGRADVKDLTRAYAAALEGWQDRRQTLSVTRQAVTLEMRVKQIEALLAGDHSCSFAALFPGVTNRRIVVVTFLAVLELIRLGRVRARQEHPFGPLTLEGSRDVAVSSP